MPPAQQTVPSADNTIEHYNGTFLNQGGLKIHCYYWKPSVKPRALLLLSHGYTEHSKLYESIAEEMARRGFFVFAHDHLGHGHSDGTRAFVSSIQDLVIDTVTHVNIVRKQYPDQPLFMCGHSMGGAVTALTSMEKDVDLSGIVLIAPAFATNPETATPFRMGVVKLMNKIFPAFPVVATDFSIGCQNEEKIKEMYQDPLRYKDYWKARPILTLINGGEEVQKRVSEVQVPFLLLHGDHDKVCHIDGSSRFYEKAPSSDKTFKVYPGGYHSLLNEPDEIATDVFDRTIEWLSSKADTLCKA